MKRAYEHPRMKMVVVHDDDKIIKVVYEGRTIEDEFIEYAERCMGCKVDNVEWSNDHMTLTAYHTCSEDEIKKFFGDIQLGVWKL